MALINFEIEKSTSGNNLIMSQSKRLLNKRRLFSTPEKRSVQNCVICLDQITKRGKLSVCEHLYCYTCILEWSKVRSRDYQVNWYAEMK